ncbi:MAG TPA: bifunctional folylpolyglutamate synthase/dihydrofolate synthase, partial [Treponemataceae bacterium]|nr:bifunctional folylpolyglutamate synthase/dihydrofolate synthase [Treponemataceae bacterium]
MHDNGNTKALELLQNWLESYLNFEKLPQKNIFWLNTMQYLCDRFKHPEKLYKKMHIAGSKGKG